jgi:hypothetical protein
VLRQFVSPKLSSSKVRQVRSAIETLPSWPALELMEMDRIMVESLVRVGSDEKKTG